MKKWERYAPGLGAYNYNSTKEDMDKPDYLISVGENISPLSSMFLDFFSNLISQKNLIISFPDNVLRPIPILAHIYSDNFKKTTLIFTSHHRGFDNRNLKEFHNLNYCMLATYGTFIIYNHVIGSIRNDVLKADIKFPKSANKKRIGVIKQNLINRLELDEPKILLFTEDNLNIIDTIAEVQIDNKLTTLDHASIDVGLVIFENVDLYVNSRYTFDRFLKWIHKYLDNGIKFVFHFSNPNSKFVDLLKNETDSFVIPFNKNLVCQSNLFKISDGYYESINNYPKRANIIKNYNLESPAFYDNFSGDDEISKVSILKPLLVSGNFQSLYFYGKKILRKIDQKKIVNKWLFRSSRKLFYSFLDMSVNPLRYKIKFCDDNGNCKYYRSIHFLEIFKQNLYKENDSITKSLLNDFIDCLISITYELGKSRHFGEKNSFERIGKEYRILEVAKNKEKYFNNSKDLIICCFNSTEVTLINEQLDNFNISGVIVRNIHWLHKSLLDNKEDYNLLLPGAIPLKYFSELFMPYAKILVLSYDDYNYKKISKQVESIDYINKMDTQKRFNYFREIYDFLNLDDDEFIRSIELENEIEIDTEVSEAPTDDYISSIIKDIFKSSEFKEDIEISEEIEQEIEEENVKVDDNVKNIKLIDFKLKNTESGDIIHKKLPLNKTFNYINDKNEFLEGSPKVIKEGNFLIFIGNDDKKRLLDFIIEIYDLDLAVDRNLIEYWKNKLMNYVAINDLNYSSFNREFNKIGGSKTISATSHWVKGEVIGPKDQHDLFLIGKLLDDDILMENYRLMFHEIEKIRTIHRLTGRRLNSVVKQIIGDKRSINTDQLGYTGQLFYEKIKNGIYEVIEKSE